MLTICSSVLFLAGLAPEPQEFVPEFLPFEDTLPLLQWTLVNTEGPIRALTEASRLLEQGIELEPDTPEFALVNQQLADLEAVYDDLLKVSVQDSMGFYLQPLSSWLGVQESPGAPVTLFYSGYEVPGLPCAAGIPEFGSWLYRFETSRLAPSLVARQSAAARAKVQLDAAQLDVELLRTQIRELSAGVTSHRLNSGFGPDCDGVPSLLSFAIGQHLARARYQGAKFALARLELMRDLAVAVSKGDLPMAEMEAANEQFQLFDNLIDAAASYLHNPHGYSVLNGSGDSIVEASLGGPETYELESADLQSSTLGIDSLEVSSALNASAAIGDLDYAIAVVAVHLVEFEQDLSALGLAP